jgi:hypothetical protein
VAYHQQGRHVLAEAPILVLAISMTSGLVALVWIAYLLIRRLVSYEGNARVLCNRGGPALKY